MAPSGFPGPLLDSLGELCPPHIAPSLGNRRVTVRTRGLNLSKYGASATRNFLVAPAAQRLGAGALDEAGNVKLYLVDGNNPTGYAQVLQEMATVGGLRSYTLGLDVVSQWDAANALAYLLYDGHGSTRALLDASGAVLQRYLYDAYGNVLSGIGYAGLTSAANAITSLLYSGEQTDKATGLQYLRARYYNPRTGRFNRLDPFSGNAFDPQSLHKYLYARANPILYLDPSGLLTDIFGTSPFGLAAHRAITKIYKQDHSFDDTSRSGRWTRIGDRPPRGVTGFLYQAKVDLLNDTKKRYAEIKPLSFSGIVSGGAQLKLREWQFSDTDYQLDVTWTPSMHITTTDLGERIAFVNVGGLVLYTDRWDLAEDVVAIASVKAAEVFFAKYGVQTIVGALGRIQQLATARVSIDSARLDSSLSIGALIATFGVV